MRRLVSDQTHLQPDEAQLMGPPQAKQGLDDINPRPVTRRRLDPEAAAKKAAATAVLKVCRCLCWFGLVYLHSSCLIQWVCLRKTRTGSFRLNKQGAF